MPKCFALHEWSNMIYLKADNFVVIFVSIQLLHIVLYWLLLSTMGDLLIHCNLTSAPIIKTKKCVAYEFTVYLFSEANLTPRSRSRTPTWVTACPSGWCTEIHNRKSWRWEVLGDVKRQAPLMCDSVLLQYFFCVSQRCCITKYLFTIFLSDVTYEVVLADADPEKIKLIFWPSMSYIQWPFKDAKMELLALSGLIWLVFDGCPIVNAPS